MLDVIKNVVIREFSSYVDLNYPWEEVTRSRAKAQDEAVCLVRAIPFLYQVNYHSRLEIPLFQSEIHVHMVNSPLLLNCYVTYWR